MTRATPTTAEDTFCKTANAFAELVSHIEPYDWERKALGVWTVRDLVGHTSRALTTVEAYLGAESTAAETLAGPVEYFLAARALLADPEAVAQRGRDAGAALGDDPASGVAEVVKRVTALVDASAGEVPVGTPIGTMTLATYLPTRIFELTVHSLDLARALNLDPPSALDAGLAAACELTGRLAPYSSDPAGFLLAVTGRSSLPTNYTVL